MCTYICNIRLLLFFLFLQTISLYSQTQKEEKTIFQTIVGEKLETSIILIPFGFHTKTPDIFGVWYTGYNYKGFEISLFQNSYRDVTLGFYIKGFGGLQISFLLIMVLEFFMVMTEGFRT